MTDTAVRDATPATSEVASEPAKKRMFAVAWEISGTMTIEAASAFEAERIFWQHSKRALAEEGDLTSFSPEEIKG